MLRFFSCGISMSLVVVLLTQDALGNGSITLASGTESEQVSDVEFFTGSGGVRKMISKSIKCMIVQFLLIFIWWASNGTIEILIRELRTAGYPKEKCKRITKQYKLLGVQKGEKIPIEMIKAQRCLNILVILFSFFLWLCLIYKKDVMGFLFAGHGFFSAVTIMIYHFKANAIAFYLRFKRLNLYNWRYFLFGFSQFKRPPQRYKIGKCKIVGERKFGKRQYYIVKLIKDGKVYEKVMYCGDTKCDESHEHFLYEIKNVYYMV